MPEIDGMIVSLVALVVATTSTLIAYQLYRLQRDPEVVVYATPDEKRPTVVNLIIENIGRSAALDVTFSSSAPVPGSAFGFDDAPEPIPMSSGPLVSGIPSLGPSSRRVITWGQYGGIHKSIGDSILDITATYRSEPALRFFRRSHTTVSRIDIKSFEHTDVSDHNWDKKAADQLKRIADTLVSLKKHSTQSESGEL